MKERYDYIIVGAGSAGCVIANRLSADPSISVLLVESGPDDDNFFVRMPRGVGVLLNPEDHDLGPALWRGAGGPLRITTHPKGDPLCEAVIQAGVEMGVRRVADINDVDGTREGGIGYQPTTTWRGRRFSAARAFLAPVRNRPNLDVVTKTDVLKIEFDHGRAVAVKVRNRQGVHRIGATREIILSAGAIETPKLLQLSGVGPGDLLRSHGIEVVADSPNVGRNLREHRHLDVRYRVRGNSQNRHLSGGRVLWSMLRYVLTSKGPMTHSTHEVGAFAKSEPGLEHADLQFGVLLVSADLSREGGKVALDPFPGITFLGYYTRPSSQGEIRIQSADPDAPPRINANQLDTEEDRRKAVAVVKWLRRLGQQPALKDWIVEEVSPGKEVRTDEDILSHALQMGGICFHISGTARMGADVTSVVDPRLRVRGVTGLRVADTSIMPALVSGNTNAAAMVIGLQAADSIRADQPR